ncbi:Sodium-coupled monocarboxylate transporter 2 [Halotydeus destructor]|nr:Sodium-coupled monocarboxylate transporter 2 [Halotydeus destructor]
MSSANLHAFNNVDYVVFCSLLSVFAGMGGYWGFKGVLWGRNKARKTTRDFLTGAASHRILPASLSLFASYVSVITILGTPAGVYYNGIQYLINLAVFMITMTFENVVVLPTFYSSGIKTVYDYLKKRFGETVFLVALALFAIYNLLLMGMWLYIPASVLSLLSGLTFPLCLTMSGAVVIFYTAFGGMKVIILTDMLQLLIIILSVTSAIVKGSVQLGGLDEVFRRSTAAERPYFDFDLNPFTEKTTIWTILIGNVIYWTSTYTTSQTAFLRYEPSSTLNKARKVMWLQVPYMTMAYFLWCFFGFVLYAYYSKCDPFITERISKSEGFIPLFVSDIGGSLPGFLGFFMVGLFSGSMSSISSSLNSLATISNEHFMKNVVRAKFSTEQLNTLYIRGVAVLLGILSLIIAALTGSQVSDSLKVRVSIANVFNCPAFGVYLLGLLNPRSNEKGALSGLCFGTMLGLYLVGTHYAFFAGESLPLGISVEGCPKFYCDRVGNRLNDTNCLTHNYTAVQPPLPPVPTSSPFEDYTFLFAWSHPLGGLMTTLATVVVGTVVSEFTESSKSRKSINKYLAWFLQDLITEREASVEAI